MIPILELTLAQLTRMLEQAHGKGRFHAQALFRQILKQGNQNFLQAREFVSSPKLASALRGTVRIDAGQVVRTVEEQGLIKFITRLCDGLEIESVINPMTRYNTLCVSSQVGCRMGCRFCETGRMGLKRNLGVAEITGQLFHARHTLKKKIKNVVFMGMGEPLDNVDAVIQAIRVMNEQQGFDVALRHITLSTAGMIPGIDQLARAGLPGIRLAVSVNGPDDATRSLLMPINQKMPLTALKQSLERFPLGKRGCFLFEYILIAGINDSAAHARHLAGFIHPLPVRLNLIPCNPIQGSQFQSPADSQMHRFADRLSARGVFVIKRWSRGRSVSAGCGQLGRDIKGADSGVIIP